MPSARAGNYTFLTHAFGDMVKGAAGILHTVGAPAPAGVPSAPTGGSDAPVLPSGTMPMAPSSGPATASAPAGAIATAMGDMWIRAATVSARAGKVTFTVANRGQMDHQFAVMRSPVKLADGLLNPSAVLTKSPQLSPGQTATVSVNLTSGSYQLVCLMPGHYSAGQHQAFAVTG